MTFSHVTQLIIQYRYLILFPLAALEGPVVAFAAGVLVSLGYFNALLAYFFLVLGDVIPDSIYYHIGRYGERKTLIARYGLKVGITEERFTIIKKLWHEHGFKTMFFSKLAYGLSTIFLVAAGFSGISARRFYAHAVPITMFQYALLMLLGFYFGDSYARITRYFENAQILFAVLAIALGIGYYFFARSLRKKFIQGLSLIHI